MAIVSASEAHCWDLDVFDHCRVPLGKLLERERTMSENLSCNRTRGFDFDAHRCLLKDAPVSVSDTIPKQSGDIRIVLVRWVRDSSTIPDDLLGIWCYPYKFRHIMFTLLRWSKTLSIIDCHSVRSVFNVVVFDQKQR